MEESRLLFPEFEIVWMDARSSSEVKKFSDSVDSLRTPWMSLVIWTSVIVGSGFFASLCFFGEEPFSFLVGSMVC